MGEQVIRTGVDKLIAFLEGREKASVLDAAAALGVSVDTLQNWVDFLVEEGILGIEYKFTKPFIYLNKEEETKAKKIGEEELSWETYHKAFLEKAERKSIPALKAASLWKNHVLTSLEEKRSFFYDEARKRQFADPDKEWQEYKTRVLLSI